MRSLDFLRGWLLWCFGHGRGFRDRGAMSSVGVWQLYSQRGEGERFATGIIGHFEEILLLSSMVTSPMYARFGCSGDVAR